MPSKRTVPEVAGRSIDLIAVQLFPPVTIPAENHRALEILGSGGVAVGALGTAGDELAGPRLDTQLPADDRAPLSLPDESLCKLRQRCLRCDVLRRSRAEKPIEPDRLTVVRALRECDDPVRVVHTPRALARERGDVRFEGLNREVHLSDGRGMVPSGSVPPQPISS